MTTRIRIVPTAITPYLWPPLPVAMSMATLAELAGDRVALAVSVGNLLNLAESGIEATRPVTAMREYVQALRSLWTGESVTAEGEINQLRGARMAFDPAATLPLYVASTGPKVLQLAGAVGDGVLLSAGLTLASCKVCLAHAEAGASAAGRAPGAVRKASFINFSVSADGVTARAAMLRKLAFLFRSKGHAENIRSSGLPIDHAAIIAALARRDLEGAAGLLPDEAAQAFAVAGTPAECRERLADYLSIGLDEPIIEISGSAEERALALEVVRELA